MKDYEKEIAAIKHCAKEVGCDGCPYEDNATGCACLRKKMVEIIEKLMAQLEQPTPACDYELTLKSYDAEIYKLKDKLCEAETAHERTQRELCEVRKELTYLRAVKATAEAFLGRKIGL